MVLKNNSVKFLVQPSHPCRQQNLDGIYATLLQHSVLGKQGYRTLDPLRSVLNVEGQPVRSFHLPRRDPLQDSQRCSDSWFQRGRYVIFGGQQFWLPRFPIILSKGNPPYAQYACHYWLDHWQLGNPVGGDVKTIRQFLGQHLLHWLEGLGLIEGYQMDKSSRGNIIWTIRRLWSRIVRTCIRRSTAQRSIVEMASLHVYYSGLLFTQGQVCFEEDI